MKNQIIRDESTEQEHLFQIAFLHEHQYPDLKLLHAIPNGGSRHPIEAANLKKQGVRAGVPDIHLPVPKAGYASLYIELKRERGGRASDEQISWINALNAAGNAAMICEGCDIAWKIILAYLNGKLVRES